MENGGWKGARELHAGVPACWRGSRRKMDQVMKAGIQVRNQPHGLTRVSAKSSARGNFEVEQLIGLAGE